MPPETKMRTEVAVLFELKTSVPFCHYSRVKNKLLPRIRTFGEITFFMLCAIEFSKVILNA
jgi:hypothetical protein